MKGNIMSKKTELIKVLEDFNKIYEKNRKGETE